MGLSSGENGVPCRILMAEDDPDDRVLLEQAFKDIQFSGELRFVEDGEALMHYLYRRGDYADSALFPRPTIIFLDLNMPKKDGRQALVEIKSDPDLCKIPVVVWTTSDMDEDRKRCREAGADYYITKPMRYRELVEKVQELCRKWCNR